MAKNPHAVSLGRKGGSVSSEKKRLACRKNWKKALAAIKAKQNENNHASKHNPVSELQTTS